MSGDTKPYPWYGIVSVEDLAQGDLLLNCPTLELPATALFATAGQNVPVRVFVENAVVMTQSCDLVKRSDGRSAVSTVILCPFFTRDELKSDPRFSKAAAWEDVRKGRLPGFHILNCCQVAGLEWDFLLVDLRRAFSLPLELVRTLASSQGSRLRLLPPYREHLSQAFARLYMRVGLPIDIVPFK